MNPNIFKSHRLRQKLPPPPPDRSEPPFPVGNCGLGLGGADSHSSCFRVSTRWRCNKTTSSTKKLRNSEECGRQDPPWRDWIHVSLLRLGRRWMESPMTLVPSVSTTTTQSDEVMWWRDNLLWTPTHCHPAADTWCQVLLPHSPEANLASFVRYILALLRRYSPASTVQSHDDISKKSHTILYSLLLIMWVWIWKVMRWLGVHLCSAGGSRSHRGSSGGPASSDGLYAS